MKEIQEEIFKNISVKLFPSQKNKADKSTRVDKKWIKHTKIISSEELKRRQLE